MTSRFILPFADVGTGITPSSGALLYFYESESVDTLKDTYSNQAGTIPNSNPVEADSLGVFPDIFISGSYKVVLTTAGGDQSWEADPISASASLPDLSADSGSSLIGFVGSIGAVARTVASKLSDVLSVKDFGAVGDGLTDDYPAFKAAYDALPAKGGKIIIPATESNKWRLSETLDIRKMVWIQGQIAQGGSSTTHGTQILVDADKAGFIFNSLGTSGYGLAVGYSYTINPYAISSMPSDGLEGAYGSILENVSIQAASGGTANVDGVVIRCQMECRKVHARGFPRHGFRIHAGINNSNADEHGDANQWILRNCKAILNAGDGLHVDGLDANAGLCDKFFSQLNTGYGCYDNSFLSNTYVSFDTAGNGIAPFWSDRITSETTLIGCHDDGGGGSVLGSACTSVGGNGLQPALGSAGFHQTGGVARFAPYKHLNQNGSEDVSASLGFNDNTLSVMSYGAESESAAANGWKFKFNPEQNVWYHQFANSNLFQPIAWGNSASKRYLDHGLTGPTFQNGYAVKSSGLEENALSRTLGASAPASNTYHKGDIVYNNNPTAGGYIGWVCITSGTAGTLNGSATTGSITTGTPDLVVNDATGLKVGQYITIAGVSGIKQITALSGTAVTIDTNASATASGAAIAWSPHTFKSWGAISA